VTSPFLSLIIPAYNEEHRLPRTLEQAHRFLSEQSYPSEVIVVENGSQDRTFELAQELVRQYQGLRVIKENQRGKGLAVRSGMLAAQGEFRFMCDVDFSMPVEEINRFIPPALINVDVAIASREAPGAKRYQEPVSRHFIGRAFNIMIRLLALPGFHDTQCGFKCFTAQSAEMLFTKQTITGWTFDVEILYLAKRMGLRIVEIPIPWIYNPESKIHVLRDSIQMALDLIRIRRNARLGIYDRQ
jgi:glycosyltransferase involved in cell wall biosynthesis